MKFFIKIWQHINLFIFNVFINKIFINFLRIWIYKFFFDIDKSAFVSMNVKLLNLESSKSNIKIGANSFVNPNVLLDGRKGKIIIGNNVDISRESSIYTLGHDPHDDYHSVKAGDVIIEDYVWISTRVTILPGVRIGRGAVIASGAVVTKDIPSMSIAAGVPARIIGTRKSALKYTLAFRPALYL